MSVSVRVRGRSRPRTVLVVAGAVVLLLALSQVLLPIIAVKLMRDRMSRYGTVKSASISAWPAIEMLWGKADSVTLDAGSITASPQELLPHLWEARGVYEARITAERATLRMSGFPHGLTATDVRARKQGPKITGSATITQQALDEAFPSGFRVQPLASSDGVVELRATGGLFGVDMSVDVALRPIDGHLVAEPRQFPLAALGGLTLLSAPHLYVESVALEVVSRAPLTYRLSFGASLR